MQDHIPQLKAALLSRRLAPPANPPHWFFLEAFAEAIDDPFEVREAKARLHFLRNVPIEIHPGEAIVGLIEWNEPFVTQVSNTYIRQDILKSILEDPGLPLEEKDSIREWIELVRPHCFDPLPHLTREERLAHQSHLAPSTFFNGHVIADFGSFIRKGLRGTAQDLQHWRNRPLTAVQENFYDAMELTLQAMSEFIQRYADLASQLLAENAPGYDPQQLRHIQAACANIAHEAPASFAEALQLVWFLMCFMDYDSFGRYDRYLLAPFERSRAEGMSEDEALLWLKYAAIKTEECGGILNMTIGGHEPDGSCTANPLTRLILRATREMGFRSPNLSLRIRAEDPDWLWEEARQTLTRGLGLPALYNDALIMPMLMDLGYSAEDAADYALAGCSQVVFPGRSNFACDVGCYNLSKALELALHNGWDPLLGEQVGPQTGSVESFHSYTDLENAYHKQMQHMTRVGTALNDKDMFLRQKEGACIRSLVTMDCLERGQGIFHGGARFYNIENEACGITNAANSLHAIRKLVFEEKTIGLPELVEVLDANWQGHEALRLRFRNKAEKFGNDSPAVDELRARLAGDWYREIQQYPAVLGGFHWPGEVVFVYHELHGAHTAASADGRFAHEPLANSAGAMSGTDTSGPTALMNSMLKIPQSDCRTCCVLNLRFSRAAWEGAGAALISLMRSYFARGGYQMQINLVSRAELVAARANPLEYADLVVRVGGFSDYFVRLPEALQEEIIARTEHDL